MPARRLIGVLLCAAVVWVAIGCSDRAPTLPDIRAAVGGGNGVVTVTATDPDSATQDTTLDVVVSGSGFDQGSQAQWAIAGIPSAKIHTNSTRFVTSKKLIANITIAIDADTGLYDVMVTASTGKKGIGSELFAVQQKGSSRSPSDQPDPVLAFLGTDRVQVMTATGSNVTTVYGGPVGSRAPSWAPFGNGTAGDPYRIVFETNAGSCDLSTIDIDTVGGVIHGTNLRALPIPGHYPCAPAWSPFGDTIAFGGAQPGGISGIYLISAGGGQVVTLYSTAAPIATMWSAWRSSGDAVAFVEDSSSKSAIKVLNRGTGLVTTVLDFGEFGFAPIRTLSWARTRDVLAFGAYRRGKWETDTIPLARDGAGNFVRAAAPVHVFNQIGATWSPDDSHLAFDGVYVLDLATGRSQKLGSGGSSPNWRR